MQLYDCGTLTGRPYHRTHPSRYDIGLRDLQVHRSLHLLSLIQAHLFALYLLLILRNWKIHLHLVWILTRCWMEIWRGNHWKAMGYMIRVRIEESSLLLLVNWFIQLETFVIILEIGKDLICLLKLRRAKKRHLTFIQLAVLWVHLRRFVILCIISGHFIHLLLLLQVLITIWTHRFSKVFGSVIIGHKWHVVAFIPLSIWWWLIDLIGRRYKPIEGSRFISDNGSHISLCFLFIPLHFFICGNWLRYIVASFWWNYLRNSTLIKYQGVCAGSWSYPCSTWERHVVIVVFIITLGIVPGRPDTAIPISLNLSVPKWCSYNFSSI